MAWLTRFASIGLLMALGACATPDPEETPLAELGNFKLANAVVRTEAARKVGPSRTIELEEMDRVLTDTLTRRFSRYAGDKPYHIGVFVDGYALAYPFGPIVLSPKSLLVVSVTVFENKDLRKLNDPPKEIYILEQLDGGTIFGSGYVRTKEQQLNNLANQLALAVERYMAANAEWFGAVSTPEAVAAAQADQLEIPQATLPEAPSGTVTEATN